MIIYVLIIIFALCFLLLRIDRNAKHKKIWLVVFFSILTIVSALRSYKVGVDSIQYNEAFNIISNLDFNQTNILRYETGFFYLVKLISLISENAQILFIITSLIIIPSIGLFIYRYSKNVVFSSLLYILFNIYFFHLTGMRQSLALVLILYAYNYAIKGKNIRFIILVILSTFFHSSAIIFIFYPIIKRFTYKRSTYISYIVISILSFIFLKSLFINITQILGKYGGYIDSKDFGVSNYFGALFQYLLTLSVYTFCHFKYKKNSNNKCTDEDEKIKSMLQLLGLDAICQIMAMKMNIIGRMHHYFWIYSIILIPNIISLEKKAKNRLLMYIFILVLAIIYWLTIAIYRPEWNGAIPYIPFWKG